MKTSTKWILGILIGLVIVASLVTIGFLAFNRWNDVGWMMQPREFRSFGGDRNMPMHPYSFMAHQRILNFNPLRFIGSLLTFSVFAFLVVFGIISLVRGSIKSQPVVTAPTQMSASAPVEIPARTCSSCGRAVQNDWSHCAYCGNTLS